MHCTCSTATRKSVIGSLIALSLGAAVFIWANGQPTQAQTTTPSQLAVVWTSGDPDVAHRVAFMYTHGAAKADWFEHVRLVVWGPSAKLLSTDEELQAYVKRMQDAGVEVQACIVCADSYGVTDDLRALDIEVKPMGVPLTEMMKDDAWDVLTF